jgi:hypothetical protein
MRNQWELRQVIPGLDTGRVEWVKHMPGGAQAAVPVSQPVNKYICWTPIASRVFSFRETRCPGLRGLFADIPSVSVADSGSSFVKGFVFCVLHLCIVFLLRVRLSAFGLIFNALWGAWTGGMLTGDVVTAGAVIGWVAGLGCMQKSSSTSVRLILPYLGPVP